MSKRAKIWVIIGLSAAIAIITAVAAIRQWATHPSDGIVRTGKPVIQTPVTDETPKERATVETGYFTVQLPAGFRVKRQTETPDKPTLLQMVADDKHQQLAITIGTLPAEGLPGVADYNVRINDATNYEPYRPAGMPTAATAFQATSGQPAFAAFWPNGTLYAEIALTSDGGARLPDLFNSFVQATHTWQWR